MANDQLNLSDFFGFDVPEEKPSKKAAKGASSITTDATVMEDNEGEEAVASSVTGDAAPATKRKASKKAIAGTDKVKVPAVIYGRNWSFKIEKDLTFNQLIAELANAGLKEVTAAGVDLFTANDGAIFVSSPKITGDSTELVVNGTTVCDGLLQFVVDDSVLSGYDEDEFSLYELQEKFAKVNGFYRECELYYDPAALIAIPMLSEKAEDTLKLPATFVVNGKEISVQTGDISFGDTVTVAEIKNYFFGDIKADICIKKLAEKYVIEFMPNKNVSIVSVSKEAFKKTNGEKKHAVEKYPLPLTAYFVTLGVNIEMTSEMFGGQNKVTEDEVISKLKPMYGILRNKDRHIECFYAKESNVLSIALTSGKKGAYALPEQEDTGIFKLIRSIEEFKAAIKSDNFLGHYHGFATARRVESTPVASYIGIMGKEYESYQVKEVQFVLKTPLIPKSFFETIVQDFRIHQNEERIVQIYWDTLAHKHVLVFPDQSATKVTVSYRYKAMPRHLKLLLTVHSHNTMPAIFSHTDNADEAITGLYGVIGTIDKTPTYAFRVGMEGCFSSVPYECLFEGQV